MAIETTKLAVFDDNYVWRSPWPDRDIPDTSLSAFLFEKASANPDADAFIQGETGRRYSFRQIVTLSQQFAAAMAKRGLAKGDIVALHAPNLIEWPIVMYGVIHAGGALTTLNPLYTAEEISRQLKDSGAKFLVTIPPLLPKAREAAQSAGISSDYTIVIAPGSTYDGITTFGAMLASVSTDDLRSFTPPMINPREDVALLPYSSGTTGLPKGVVLTHRNVVANLTQYFNNDGADNPGDDTVSLGLLPLFHSYGLFMLNNVMLSGKPMVVISKFELEPFCKILQDYKVTHAALVPPLVLALVKNPVVDKYKYSLRVAGCAAASLGAGIADAFERKFNGCKLRQGYGMTELSPCCHNASLRAPVKLASVGHLLPNTEAKVVSIETGRALPPCPVELAGDTTARQPYVGELWVRGPQVMKGYHGNPEATANIIDAEGWLHTGDLAFADTEGYFYIIERLKELVKYKGYQVPPAELEALLLTQAAVADAAVVSSWDAEGEEIPKAFIVPKDPGVLTATPDEKAKLAEQLVEHVAAHVAPFKKIRAVEFVDSIPKTLSGKILRTKLKERERTAFKERLKMK